MSHTLGPWEISDWPRKSSASGKLMYHVDGPEIITDYEDWGYTKGSARLIAAAPELLEALKDALFHVANQGDVGVDQWLACERKARNVIAKVEGT